jgi:hypothetical protein
MDEIMMRIALVVGLAIGLYSGLVKINKTGAGDYARIPQSVIDGLIEAHESKNSTEVEEIKISDGGNSKIGAHGATSAKTARPIDLPKLDISSLLEPDARMKKAIMNNDINTVRKLAGEKLGLGFEAPICYAVSYGNIEIVQILLEAGVDVDQKNNDGKTAIAIAREQQNEELVKILENAGSAD